MAGSTGLTTRRTAARRRKAGRRRVCANAGTTVLANRAIKIKMLVRVLDIRLPVFDLIPALRALDLRNLNLRIFDLVVFSVSISTPISAPQGLPRAAAKSPNV